MGCRVLFKQFHAIRETLDWSSRYIRPVQHNYNFKNQIGFISGNIWPIQTSRKTVNIKNSQ